MIQSPRDDDAKSTNSSDIDDGVDVTLIRWMLALAPIDRLRVVERNANALARVLRGRSRS